MAKGSASTQFITGTACEWLPRFPLCRRGLIAVVARGEDMHFPASR